MGSRKYEMKIKELEAQVQMLKKSEAEMRKRYSDAMRRVSEHEEFNW